jgi:uncharacterized protein YdhG (YjbR/CyaY superfamily)
MGNVTDYIAGLDEPARSVLERYRARAVAVVPEAEEGTSYGMAGLRYRGRPLISVVSTKQGYSVFPFSSAVVESVIAEFNDFESTKGGIKSARASSSNRFASLLRQDGSGSGWRVVAVAGDGQPVRGH